MVIFDLDGTLWDASEGLAISWAEEYTRQTQKEKHFTVEEIRSVLGLTMTDIADHLIPEIEEAERYRVFEACMDYEIVYLREHGAQLFPGVRETLGELVANGVKLAIVSNCQTGYIPAFLDSMNMHEYFCDIEEWGNTGLPKAENIKLVMKRNGEPHSIYVGDIQKDCDAATEAGIPCIWARYGFGTMEHPAAIIDHFYELPRTLKEIGF